MLKMLVGLSLASVVCGLLLDGGSYKKYVNSILGVVTLLVIIEGVFSLEPIKNMDSFFTEAESSAKLVLSETEREIASLYEENIKKQLEASGYEVFKVSVFLNSKMELKSLHITVRDKAEDITDILEEKLGINPQLVKIEIKEEK